MVRIFKSLADVIPVKKNGVEQLGEGSFAKVKMVVSKDNPTQKFAMKTINIRGDKDRVQVFKEIQFHQSLQHENIIRFEDYIDSKKEIHIFLELAENGDLFSYINRVRCSEADLTRFFVQTCRAMQYMHNKNIMHRDLKPENILLDSGFNIKVCDFGWSAEFNESIPRETLCGTFEYMAPEVLLRKRQTTKTDVWALGILLYELFHGNAPFRGRRLEEVLERISKNTLAFKRTLNPLAKDLIARILKFYPHERPTVDQILESEFVKEFLNGPTAKRQQRSMSPSQVPQATVQNGCFLKAKEGKIDTFFDFGQQPIETVKEQPRTQQQFVNIYLDRPPLEQTMLVNAKTNLTNQFNKRVHGQQQQLFGSFTNGVSTNDNSTPSKQQFQSFAQATQFVNDQHQKDSFDVQTVVKTQPISGQNTPQKSFTQAIQQAHIPTSQPVSHVNNQTTHQFHSSRELMKSNQRINTAQIGRAPVNKTIDHVSHNHLPLDQSKQLNATLKYQSTRVIDTSARSIDHNKVTQGVVRRVESQSHIQVRSHQKNPTDQLRNFLHAPQLQPLFSQQNLSVSKTDPNDIPQLYKAQPTAPIMTTLASNTVQTNLLMTPVKGDSGTPTNCNKNASSRFINYNHPDNSPRVMTPSDQNKCEQPQSTNSQKKAVSSTPNPVYRKVASNTKLYGNFLGTFQKV